MKRIIPVIALLLSAAPAAAENHATPQRPDPHATAGKPGQPVVAAANVATSAEDIEAGDSEPNEVSRTAEQEHAHHPGWRLGFFGAGLGNLALGGDKSDWAASSGAGFFLKREVRRWLVLAVSSRVLAVPSEKGIEIPVEFFLEVPFHLTHNFHPYIGVGPALGTLLYREDGERKTRVSAGAAGVAGAEYWVANQAALFAELNVNWLRSLDTSVDSIQVGGAAGVLVAF